MTDNITFERIERDCPANETARQKSNNPRLIYDFKVEIDGEFRAYLSKEVYGRGYRLYDANHRAIPEEGHYAKHLGALVERQSEFFSFIRTNLHRIPTLAQMAALREQEAQRKTEIDRQARQNVRDRIAASQGPSLLRALKHLLAVVDESHPDHEALLEAEAENAAADERHPSFEHMKEDAFGKARAAIAEAEDLGEHFEERVEQEVWSLSR